MNNPTNPKTPAEIQEWRIQELCRTLVGSSLQMSDSHDGEEGKEHQPLMTKNGAWYFVPHYDDPALIPYRVLPGGVNGPPRDPSRPRWGIEAPKVYAATREEPESWDIVEVARHNSLEEALQAVGHLALEQQQRDAMLDVWTRYEMKMAPHIEDYMTSTE